MVVLPLVRLVVHSVLPMVRSIWPNMYYLSLLYWTRDTYFWHALVQLTGMYIGTGLEGSTTATFRVWGINLEYQLLEDGGTTT